MKDAKRAKYKIATLTGVETVEGYTVGNLGLRGSGNRWAVTHLPTGKKLTVLECDFNAAVHRLLTVQQKFKIPWHQKDLINFIDSETSKRIRSILMGGQDDRLSKFQARNAKNTGRSGAVAPQCRRKDGKAD